MNINTLLQSTALNTGPNVLLPDGTQSRNIRYYLPILEAAGQESGLTYTATWELYQVATNTPIGAEPTTGAQAVALLETATIQLGEGVDALNLFGGSNAGVVGSNTSIVQALSKQLSDLAGFSNGPTGIFLVTAAAKTKATGGPDTVTSFAQVQTGIGNIDTQLQSTITTWGTTATIWGIIPSTDLFNITSEFTTARVATEDLILEVNATTLVLSAAAPTGTAPAAEAALLAEQSMLNAILAWATSNSGGPAVSIAAGGPFASIRAWALAQGIILP